MRTRKTWREKMSNPNLPKVVAIPPKMQKRMGTGTMVLPTPQDVETAIRSVPQGSVISVPRLRQFLAGKYEVDAACPLVTGIFVRIAAEAAEEEARAGELPATPYWRVVKEDGSLYPKFPGGTVRQAQRLRAEGVAVVKGRVRLE
jgi:hypothetical protein